MHQRRVPLRLRPVVVALLLAGCHGGDTDTDPVGHDLAADTTPIVVSSEACDACGGDCVDELLAYTERYHTTEPIDYSVTPPAGGPHDPCWADFGVHDEPVEDDNFVHDLEHGAVVILWNCPDGCGAEQASIDALVPTLGEFALSTPYSEMESPFAVVAWEHRLLLGCFDADATSTYYAEHVDQGPESTSSAPPGGCMGD